MWSNFESMPGPKAKSILAAGIMLLCLVSCKSSSSLTSSSELKETQKFDIRLTEEPYEKQKYKNKKMAILIQYLEDVTKLKIAYVPAINYAHSYALFRNGDVDLINVGIYGGYQILKNNPEAVPIAIQKPSMRNILITNQQTTAPKQKQDLNPGEAKNTPFPLLLGKRVGFGSRFSGSSFMHPLLEMQKNSLVITDLAHCNNEPIVSNLPSLVATGFFDFAFLHSYHPDPLSNVPSSIKSKVKKLWESEPKRNAYIIAQARDIDETKRANIELVKQAILSLNSKQVRDKIVLDAWGYTGFDLPTDSFPKDINLEIEQLIRKSGRLPTCNKDYGQTS